MEFGGGAFMKYQDCVEAVQAADEADGEDTGGPRLADANINPATGLATDYLNHFNEAIILLDMLSKPPGLPRRLPRLAADELSRAFCGLALLGA